MTTSHSLADSLAIRESPLESPLTHLKDLPIPQGLDARPGSWHSINCLRRGARPSREWLGARYSGKTEELDAVGRRRLGVKSPSSHVSLSRLFPPCRRTSHRRICAPTSLTTRKVAKFHHHQRAETQIGLSHRRTTQQHTNTPIEPRTNTQYVATNAATERTPNERPQRPDFRCEHPTRLRVRPRVGVRRSLPTPVHPWHSRRNGDLCPVQSLRSFGLSHHPPLAPPASRTTNAAQRRPPQVFGNSPSLWRLGTTRGPDAFAKTTRLSNRERTRATAPRTPATPRHAMGDGSTQRSAGRDALHLFRVGVRTCPIAGVGWVEGAAPRRHRTNTYNAAQRLNAAPVATPNEWTRPSGKFSSDRVRRVADHSVPAGRPRPVGDSSPTLAVFPRNSTCRRIIMCTGLATGARYDATIALAGMVHVITCTYAKQRIAPQ
ncbi:hypothetical protein C8R43DRAFT_1117835 [Mycena crocata]|nr:hypothetical protein C8R43DRAFT_1117835 [Mycena crocata]